MTTQKYFPANRSLQLLRAYKDWKVIVGIDKINGKSRDLKGKLIVKYSKAWVQEEDQEKGYQLKAINLEKIKYVKTDLFTARPR